MNKKLKIINYLSFLLFIAISCKKQTPKEDVLKRFPNQEIDTIIDFDFNKNGIKDNIGLLISNNGRKSMFFYMDKKFVSINDNVIPKSTLGYDHSITIENNKNTLILRDVFSTVNPRAIYELKFRYHQPENKIRLDSVIIKGKEEGAEMPYFKTFLRKKVDRSKALSIENDNFLTKDTLDFINF